MIDIQQVFDGTISAAGVVTGAALTVTRVSTNVIDLLVARDIGAGNELGLHCNVLTALTGATSLVVNVEVGATEGGTYYNLMSTPVIPVAQLIAGAPIFRYSMPMNQVLNATAGVLSAPGRYLRLNYTVVGTFGAGTVFAYINPINDRQQTYIYPENYTTATLP
jgi:hypothetical protein